MFDPGFVWVFVESWGKGTPQMQDEELYQDILGLESSWSVSEVKLDLRSK